MNTEGCVEDQAPLRAEIMDVENVIENEIAQGATQKSVAMT